MKTRAIVSYKAGELNATLLPRPKGRSEPPWALFSTNPGERNEGIGRQAGELATHLPRPELGGKIKEGNEIKNKADEA